MNLEGGKEMDNDNMYPNQNGGTDSGYQQYGENYSGSQQYGGNDSSYQQYNGNNSDSNFSQYQYNNNGYQNPYYVQPPQTDMEEPISVGEWILMHLIMMVPCVGLIMVFVWAFSNSEKKSKSNYFKAKLIMFGIIFALYMVFFLFLLFVEALLIIDYVWYCGVRSRRL